MEQIDPTGCREGNKFTSRPNLTYTQNKSIARVLKFLPTFLGRGAIAPYKSAPDYIAHILMSTNMTTAVTIMHAVTLKQVQGLEAEDILLTQKCSSQLTLQPFGTAHNPQ